MYDIVIIGKGPAGVSAALYALRAGMNTLVIGSGTGALEKAEKIENYYGLEYPVSGTDLQKIGEKQVVALGGSVIHAEVTGVGMEDTFVVDTATDRYPCRAVILAVGKTRKSVKIPGLRELEGRGVSYCAVCDGFFFRGKTLGVLGNGDYALNEARHLAGFAQSVTVFTDGLELNATGDNPFQTDTRKIASLAGEDKLHAVVTTDGDEVPLDGLFVAVGSASAADFALKLGVMTDNGNIVVDKDNMTNLPGIFAAGDCIGGFNQLSTAVGEGAVAGQRAADYVKRNG